MADVEVKQEAAYEPESHALPTPQAETAPLSPGTSPTPSHTYNVFVGDLAPNITESLLRSHFSQYGDIKLVNIIRDKVTGACKGTKDHPWPLQAQPALSFQDNLGHQMESSPKLTHHNQTTII